MNVTNLCPCILNSVHLYRFHYFNKHCIIITNSIYYHLKLTNKNTDVILNLWIYRPNDI